MDFDDFLQKYAGSFIPRLPEFISDCHVPVVLFVLCKDWEGENEFKWQQLRDRFLSTNLMQFTLVCPKMLKSEIKGEANYNSEAVLLLPYGFGEGHLDELADRLKIFSRNLSNVLNQDVVFKCRGTLCDEMHN